MAEPRWSVSWPATQASSRFPRRNIGVEQAGGNQLCPVVVEEAGGGVIHTLPAEFFDDDLPPGGEQCDGMRQGVVQALGVVQRARE